MKYIIIVLFFSISFCTNQNPKGETELKSSENTEIADEKLIQQSDEELIIKGYRLYEKNNLENLKKIIDILNNRESINSEFYYLASLYFLKLNNLKMAEIALVKADYFNKIIDKKNNSKENPIYRNKILESKILYQLYLIYNQLYLKAEPGTENKKNMKELAEYHLKSSQELKE